MLSDLFLQLNGTDIVSIPSFFQDLSYYFEYVRKDSLVDDTFFQPSFAKVVLWNPTYLHFTTFSICQEEIAFAKILISYTHQYEEIWQNGIFFLQLSIEAQVHTFTKDDFSPLFPIVGKCNTLVPFDLKTTFYFMDFDVEKMVRFLMNDQIWPLKA